LEQWEMNRKIRRFSRQGEDHAESSFCSDWCKGHFDGHEQRVLTAFKERAGRLNHQTLQWEPIVYSSVEPGGHYGD
jgi:hypothetical protein